MEEAFEEFEEDVIEEDIEEDIPTSSSPASATLDPAEQVLAKYQSFHRDLTTSYGLSNFALRSFLPSPKLIKGLIDTTQPEQLDETLEMVAKWRGKGLPLSQNATKSLVARCVKYRRPSTMVDVFSNKTKYGVEISDIRQVDMLFNALCHPAREAVEVAEGGKHPHVEEIYTLLALTRLYVPESTPDAAGEIAALSLSVRMGEVESERVKTLVKNLKGMGSEGLVEFINSLSGKRRDWVPRRVATIAEELEKAGDASSASWFRTVNAAFPTVP